MLQDLEAGKRLELDALIVAVVELAELTGTPAPTLQALAASARCSPTASAFRSLHHAGRPIGSARFHEVRRDARPGSRPAPCCSR